MSHPIIYLEPIDRQARALFARKDLSEDSAASFVGDLRAELAKIDEAIASVNGQLETRTDDPRWAASAMRALFKYREQKKSVLALIKTAEKLLGAIRQSMAEAQRLAIAGAKAQTIETVARISAREREQKETDRLARIREANDISNKFNVHFRKVLRREIGQAEFDRVMGLAQKEFTP